MFGVGIGEMLVIGLLLLVVVGPRELPKLLRTVGNGINKLKQMSGDLRDQSGIDEIIEHEELQESLSTLRSLSRGRAGVVDSLMRTPKPNRKRIAAAATAAGAALPAAIDDVTPPDESHAPDPDVEYPILGCDNYGAAVGPADPYLSDDEFARHMYGDNPPDDQGDDDAGDAAQADDAPKGGGEAEDDAEEDVDLDEDGW